MCAVRAKTNGQNANQTAATNAARESPVRWRVKKYAPANDSRNAINTTELCAAYGLRVSQYTGIASAPAPRLASEYASVPRFG